MICTKCITENFLSEFDNGIITGEEFRPNDKATREEMSKMLYDACIKAGVTLNPHTPVSLLEDIVSDVDMVLIMSVNPGFGGQKMIPYTIEKVRELKKIVDEKGYEVDIEVDGGITLENVEQFLAAGANIIVAGSSVFNGDVEENVKCFLDKLNA